MIKEDQIFFELKAQCRYDEEVKAYVGYIPRLRIFTQARTKERLPLALKSAAMGFIRGCAEKGILLKALHDRGAKTGKITAEQLQGQKKGGKEYVAVLNYEECKETVNVSIPMSLLVAQQQQEVSA